MRAPGRAFGLLAGFLAGFLNSLLNSLLDSLLNSLLDSRIAGRDGGFAVVGGFSAPLAAVPGVAAVPRGAQLGEPDDILPAGPATRTAARRLLQAQVAFQEEVELLQLSAPSPSSILMVIWNESISLCFSKSPRQVKLYTSYVSASTTLRRRCSRTLSFWTSASSGTR